MKLHHIILSAAAVLMGLAACSKSDEVIVTGQETQENLVPVTLGANFAATKTTMAENGDILWLEGDQISVKVGNNSYDFTLDSGAGTTSGTFSALVTESDAAIIASADGNVTACYPKGGASVPDTQTWADGTFADETFPMTATLTSANTLTFTNPASIVMAKDVKVGDATSAELNYTVNSAPKSKTITGISITEADLLFVVEAGADAESFTLTLNGSSFALKCYTSANTEAGSRYILNQYTCKIGDTQYKTLAEAVVTVADNTPTTITMIANEAIIGNAGVAIGANKEITLDLNGQTVKNLVSADANSQTIENFGTLTITGDGTLTNDVNGHTPGSPMGNNWYTNVITNHATLNINGNIIQTADGGACYCVDNITNNNLYTVNTTVTGGTFTSAGNTAIRMFCNSHTNENNLTINGGYFEGGYYAVSMSLYTGRLTITDGEFESRADEWNCCIANWNDGSENLSVSISGGKFNDYVVIGKNTNTNVTGGLFKYKSFTDTDDQSVYALENYVADGYAVVDNTDAETKDAYPYTVEQANVAKIGETEYATLAEAFTAAESQTNITLELLRDVDLKNEAWPRIVFTNKIFNGKGHTVSNLNVTGEVTGTGFISDGACSVVKNLTIDGATVTGVNQVAAIVGAGLCTEIENCHVKNATVTSNVHKNGDDYDDGDKPGAICGYLSGESNAWVKNCTATSCTITGYRDLGALVGYANGTAEVSGNTATNVSVICTTKYGTDENYKHYILKKEYDANEIVGEKSANATVYNNTSTGVTITYNPDFTDPVAKVVIGGNTTYYTSLAEALNAGTASGATCTLLSDVDLKDIAWTPVVDFNGTFDGKNFTISNLTVSGTGLFASTNTSATIKDLTIDKATVNSTSDNCGILAGGISGSIVNNVKIKNSTLTTTGERVGALCGTGYPAADGCTVDNCKITGKDQVGGAIGYMWVGSIKNCTVTNNTIYATDVRAGGLIGKFQCSSGNLGNSTMYVQNNTISGTVTDTNNSTGGIAGQIMGNDARYYITGNTINLTSSVDCPIGLLRDNTQDKKFTSVLAAHITGNTWDNTTYATSTYTYTAEMTNGAGDQVINGTSSTPGATTPGLGGWK